MSRAIKELIVQDYEKRFRDVSDLAVVSAQGLDVGRMTALRRSLREKGFRAMIVKNRLCRRAFEAVGMEAAVGLLRGPSALVWGGEGIVEHHEPRLEAAQIRRVGASRGPASCYGLGRGSEQRGGLGLARPLQRDVCRVTGRERQVALLAVAEPRV